MLTCYFSTFCRFLFVCFALFCFVIYLFIKSQPTYHKKFNEVGVCQRMVCQKREFAVRLSSCEDNDPKLKNETFVRIDMKHSYFSNYLFAMNFSVVEAVVVAKN